MTHDDDSAVGRYVGRRDDTGGNVLWWAPPGGAPRERLAPVHHRSVDGPNWGYEGNGPTDAAEAILLHATGDPASAERHARAFAADVLAREPIDRFLDLPAATVEDWALQRAISLAPGWSPLGAQPVVESTRTNAGVERYTVALDGWQLLRLDLPGPEPVAVVGVADLKSRREVRWSRRVAVAERGDEHEPGPTGARVTSEALPFGGWAIQVDGFDAVIVERGSASSTDVRVAVYDRTPDSGFLVFDEFVRYRQLATEPVAVGELLRRFSGTTGRDRVRGR